MTQKAKSDKTYELKKEGFILSVFICPICKEKLNRTDTVYFCPNHHSYDISAEGYVHLLPPNKMHAKIPGDNKQMVSSRRDFLATGLYQPFSDKLNELVYENIADSAAPIVVDAGCGEGYYTARLQIYFAKNDCKAVLAGFDISKFAVKAAAKRYKNTEFAVASMFDIPVADASADCLYAIFAPIVPDEFARVLKPGGSLILAVPGERHLYGLKEILYENPYENEYKETIYEGFTFCKRVPVWGEIYMDNPKTIADLFAMTPYYWKTSIAGSERLKETKELNTEIEFDFLVYRKD